MYEKEIFFKDIISVKEFVATVAKYEKLPINLISDIYTIDAHSLIGIISLDISNPMRLSVPVDQIPESFYSDIDKYIYVPNTWYDRINHAGDQFRPPAIFLQYILGNTSFQVFNYKWANLMSRCENAQKILRSKHGK